jgi:RNA-binding protein YlmH
MMERDLLKRLKTPEEKLALAKVLDRLFLCLNNGVCAYSDFINILHANKFIQWIQDEYGASGIAYGGADDCERVMIGFCPDDVAPEFPVCRVLIKYNDRFGKLTHRDFLGSLLGLGLDRRMIGDIIADDTVIAFVHKNIADDICSNLKQVKRSPVSAIISNIPADSDALPRPDSGSFVRVSVKQPRLDSVISAAFHLSRQKAGEVIKRRVSVDYSPVTADSHTVKVNQIITVRGYGRIVVQEISHGADKVILLLKVYS